MGAKSKCDAGQSWNVSTRVAGLKTYLFVEPYVEGERTEATACTYHFLLCDQSDHDVQVPEVTADPNSSKAQKIDVSACPGAMMEIRNTGSWPFYAWTDY